MEGEVPEVSGYLGVLLGPGALGSRAHILIESINQRSVAGLGYISNGYGWSVTSQITTQTVTIAARRYRAGGGADQPRNQRIYSVIGGVDGFTGVVIGADEFARRTRKNGGRGGWVPCEGRRHSSYEEAHLAVYKVPLGAEVQQQQQQQPGAAEEAKQPAVNQSDGKQRLAKARRDAKKKQAERAKALKDRLDARKRAKEAAARAAREDDEEPQGGY